MPATYLLFGEPDWVGMLFYAVVFFGSLAAFVFVVRLIYVRVFRSKEEIMSISSREPEEGADGRRRK